jgi:hypothetical protein
MSRKKIKTLYFVATKFISRVSIIGLRIGVEFERESTMALFTDATGESPVLLRGYCLKSW